MREKRKNDENTDGEKESESTDETFKSVEEKVMKKPW